MSSEGKRDCPYCGKPDCHEWQHARDEADYLHDVLDSTFDERDKARAEVERLRERLRLELEGRPSHPAFAHLAEEERLREALEELIDVAAGMDGQIEQEWGVSTDPGYGEEHPAITKARAALSPDDSRT